MSNRFVAPRWMIDDYSAWSVGEALERKRGMAEALQAKKKGEKAAKADSGEESD